jgi:hypothetical protein
LKLLCGSQLSSDFLIIYNLYKFMVSPQMAYRLLLQEQLNRANPGMHHEKPSLISKPWLCSVDKALRATRRPDGDLLYLSEKRLEANPNP